MNPLSPRDTGRGGLQLGGVSVFSAYYTAGTPFGVSVSARDRLDSDLHTGVSTAVGWAKAGRNSNASVMYAPSYVRSVHNPEMSTVNHNLTLNWSAAVGRKWTVGASAAGIAGNLEQMLFSPTQLANLASVPVTFDQLAVAVLAGRFSDPQLASLVGGVPVLNSPERTFVYGNRVLSATLQATLSYAPSQRSTFQVAAYGTRAQHLRRSGISPEAQAAYGIPQTSTAGVNLSWSWSVTPRTHIGADLSSSRMFSRFQQAYVTSADVSIGRTMSRRWFVQGRIGAGILTHLRQTSAGPRGTHYVAGGGIGYKTFAHTFLVSCNRNIADSYGIGANATLAATGAWSWRRPGSVWGAYANAGHQRLQGWSPKPVESWTGTLGLTRTLGAQLSLNVQYGYFQLPAYAILSRGDVTQSGVVVSLNWMPFVRRPASPENPTVP